ncbi:MAG: methyltransferase domain-containing protein [Saprospiraceae bacterium]
MYYIIKKTIKHLLPRKLFFTCEPLLRSILYLFYKGDHYICNICAKKLSRFLQINNGDKLCPNCGSLPRSRRLYYILQQKYLKPFKKILDFSPSRCLYRKLKKIPSIFYYSTDISGDFISDHHYNIEKIDSLSEQFDLIICYHILEHIQDDIQAIKELYRIMKFSGTAIIQTPFKVGDNYEDRSIISSHDRLKHFGQEDHVRIYSIQGLKSRLESCGFQVEILSFSEMSDNIYGYKTKEDVLICRK